MVNRGRRIRSDARKAVAALVRRVVRLPQAFGDRFLGTRTVYLLDSGADESELRVLAGRVNFYTSRVAPGDCLVVRRLPVRTLLNKDAVLVRGGSDVFARAMVRCRENTWDVDERRNPLDAWAWSAFAQSVASNGTEVSVARDRFVSALRRVTIERLSSVYVFGTGPSLALASERSWSDGYRIVCNTIVRDVDLWNHIDPHFVCAGDGLYHFSDSSHARAFRRDLRLRLESSNACFAYPSLFDPLVKEELGSCADRLIPVSVCSTVRPMHVSLLERFCLPPLGNVLALLLLPLACTLGTDVKLWGFDGRAPGDRLFWKNSSRHSYPELMAELEEEHPAFFAHHVPRADPFAYVRDVHGDALEEQLSRAERAGFTFSMLHPSHTPVLQRRYVG